MKKWLYILKQTFQEWNEDKATRLSAALAYYSIFSLAPLLVIAISVAGFLFGEEAARGQIQEQLQNVLGAETAAFVQTMVANARESGGGIWATILSVALLLFGATGVFNQLKDALNTIWQIKPEGRGVKGMLLNRLLALGMVLVIGFLLLASMVLTTVLRAATGYLDAAMPVPAFFWQALNLLVSLAIITVLFAAIFRILPDAEIPWNDIWLGAAVTAVLFVLGEWLLSFYLRSKAGSSALGAAGSLIVILIWVYYSAMILFFGAEFTQVYIRRGGRIIRPTDHAEKVRMVAESQSENQEPRE
jgi:membrane protein